MPGGSAGGRSLKDALRPPSLALQLCDLGALERHIGDQTMLAEDRGAGHLLVTDRTAVHDERSTPALTANAKPGLGHARKDQYARCIGDNLAITRILGIKALQS